MKACILSLVRVPLDSTKFLDYTMIVGFAFLFIYGICKYLAFHASVMSICY